MEMISDIYISPNFIKDHKPFAQLKNEHDQLIRSRDYHSQTVLEFFLFIDAVDLMHEGFISPKQEWISKPHLTEFFHCALINQRTSEVVRFTHLGFISYANSSMQS